MIRVTSVTRPAMTGLGLALLVLGVALHGIDPDLYLRLMRHWVPEAVLPPFIDTTYVIGQMDCWRRGVDVYAANPCDMFTRPMVYPPLWLRLWFLPDRLSAAVPFGLTIGLSFILSLMILPRSHRWRDLVLMLAAIASSAVVYGFERGNVDLLIFAAAALIVLSIGRSFPVRLAGYAAILLLGLLKLYPLALAPLIARERRPVAFAIAVAMAAVLGLSVWLWHDQWLAMARNLPGPDYSTDGPGGRKLAEGVFIALERVVSWLSPAAHLDDLARRRVWIALLFPLLSLTALFTALRLARGPRLPAAVAALPPRETACLAVGALLFCGFFMAGTSIAYREVFLLFVIPALLTFSRDPTLPAAIRWTPFPLVLLMCASYPALWFDITFGKLDATGGPLPTFAFWAVRELIWWWCFTVLMATLFCRASLAGLIDLQTQPQRGGGGGGGIGNARAEVAGRLADGPASTIQPRSLSRI